jgi:hypothetical protein
MNKTDRRIRKIVEQLQEAGSKFALVGGLAVSIRSRPRFTKDVDLTVAVNGDSEAEELTRQLQKAGYKLLSALEHKPTGRLATVRMSSPRSRDPAPDIDLLFASCGIEQEIVAAAEELTLPGIALPVATSAHLIAMKILADQPGRPDSQDLVALIRSASKKEIEKASAALLLIKERRFDRGKDLQAKLVEYLRLCNKLG